MSYVGNMIHEARQSRKLWLLCASVCFSTKFSSPHN